MLKLVIEDRQGSGDVHIAMLRAICGQTGGKSMVDLGCGHAPTTRMLDFPKRVYVDCVKRDIGEPCNPLFIEQDIFSYLNSCEHFDVSILLDAIEHFRFDKAWELIHLMKSKSNKQILFTPYGEYMMTSDLTDNHPDTHKSGWLPEMLDGWASVVFPRFHPTLSENGLGAFYAWRCANIEQDFERVCNELKGKI